MGNAVIGGWRPLGIRPRFSLLAALFVALPLLFGLAIFVTLLTRAVSGELRATLDTESAAVVAAVADDGPSALSEVDLPDGYRAQVLSQPGASLAASPTSLRGVLSQLRPGAGESSIEGIQRWWTPWRDTQPPLVQATGTTHEGQELIVLVSAPQEPNAEIIDTTAARLLGGIPVLMLASGLLAWLLIGRTLGPVEAIRTQVESISSSNLHRRVPVPPGRDEIASLARTMNTMLQRLERAQSATEAFISDASHELRSPVTSLTAALELATTADDPAVWDELAPLLRAEAARLEGLVSGLILLSRADDQGLSLSLEEVDLDEIVLSEADRLREISDVPVRLRVRAVRVWGDEAKLAQVLRNLVDNAARHAGGAVLIELDQQDDRARIAVSDDGAGVALEDRTRVFERFVRLDEGRSRDDGGSGLGLAIVSEIVAAHEGSVWVDSSPELGGARFTVTVPTHRSIDEAPDATTPASNGRRHPFGLGLGR